MGEDVPFIGLSREHFPFTIEWYNRAGEVRRSIVVEDVGAVYVPGQDFFGEPVGVRMIWPTGLVTETPNPEWSEGITPDPCP